MNEKCFLSLEDIGQIVLSHNPLVLLEGDSEGVEEVLSVSLAEHLAVSERGAISGSITVLLNGLNNVSETLILKLLLSNESVDIIALLGNVGEASLVDITRVNWVSHQPLVVWDWPGWGGHDSEGVVSIWVDRIEHGSLGEGSLRDYTKK